MEWINHGHTIHVPDSRLYYVFVLTIIVFHLPTILQRPCGNMVWNVWAMNKDSLGINVSLILETAGKAAIIRANTWKKENSGHVRCGSELVSLESTYNPGYTSHKSNLNFQNGGSSTSQGKTWIRLEEDKQIDLKSYSVSPTWESQKERNKSNSLYSPSVSYHRRGDTSDISVPILDHLVNQLRSQQIKGHRVDPSANQMQV